MEIKGVELTEEMLEKLDTIESFEELKALAKEAGIEASDEELAECFDEELKAFKIPEEDLELVAGGSCGFTCDVCKDNCDMDCVPYQSSGYEHIKNCYT